MARPRIALLNASEDANTPRNFRRELDADLTEFDVHNEVPETYAFDAAVVTGSRASVYWDESWMSPLKEWVATAVGRGMPVLGVCYGHQVLAEALGGTVEDMGEYEIGYREVNHEGGPLFENIDTPITVFTTHSDTVTELPPGAEEFATNEYGIHGFQVENAFGVQFHPEYDMETAEAVTRGKDLPDERIQSVVSGINEENYTKACESKALFENFTEYVKDVRTDEPISATSETAADD